MDNGKDSILKVKNGGIMKYKNVIILNTIRFIILFLFAFFFIEDRKVIESVEYSVVLLVLILIWDKLKSLRKNKSTK
jgi:hypothetical protein